jgi:tetratricopeptide (TPR) repeat protein
MSGDTASLAAGISPYVSAAVDAYGGGVLAPGREDAADTTAGLGRRLLRRLFGSRDDTDPLPPALAELAADPADDDALAAVRLAVRRMLTADPALAADVSALLAAAPGVSQRVSATRDAYTAAGHQTIINVTGGPGQTYWPGTVPHAAALGTADGPVVVGDIPQEPPGFQPRPDLLDELDQPDPRASVVRAVTGMRGVGKTQLAAAYARSKLSARWRLVAWVSANDLSSLLAGLAAVADAVGLATAGHERAEADAGRAVRHWLETDGDRCLVVFDNVTDPDVLRPFVPAGGAARVLITSALRSAANLGLSVGVEVFTGEEAEAFLAGRTGLADPAGAAAIAAELGFLPLALAQAAAVIAGQYLSYGTYLERLRGLPVRDHLTRERGQPYPHGVAETVLLSLEAVRTGDRGRVCAGVMEIMAMLSAAGVRREVLYDAGQSASLGGGDEAGVPAPVVDAVLAELVERSLLTFSLDRQTVSAHRLVMRVVRDGLLRQGRQADVWEAAATALHLRARALVGSGDRLALRDIAEQVTALGSIVVSDSELGMLIRLRSWALYYLNELGDSARQAIMLGEPLIADLERTQGADHPDTLNARNSLAIAFRAAGRDAQAIRLDEQTLAVRERVLGPDHPDTLDSRNNVAVAYRAAGRTAEAARLHEQTLVVRERVLGPEHPSTLISQSNLAVVYQEAGRSAEAARLHERTLAARERVLGPDHPDTLQSRNNLATTYRAAGRAAEAASLHERTLAARERVLGPDHPDTLQSRNNLAITYLEAGRATEAIPLHEETLAAFERVLGHDHPHTLQSRNNLAVAYLGAGLAAAAIQLHEQTLTARETVLGSDHPDTLQSRRNLADARAHSGTLSSGGPFTRRDDGN